MLFDKFMLNAFPFFWNAAIPREHSRSHEALPAWLKCFTQSFLGGLLHQNNLPLCLRIIQVPWCPLLLLCSQPQGAVMLNLGLELGLVRRSSVEIPSLHDVIPGYLQCSPQSFHRVQCFLDPWNYFHKVQLMVCHNLVTPGAGILLKTHKYPKILKQPDPTAKPQSCWHSALVPIA